MYHSFTELCGYQYLNVIFCYVITTFPHVPAPRRGGGEVGDPCER